MAVQVKTLKEIVLAYVCRNIDILFIKELYKISKYLRENDCDDVTEYFIDNQELNEESLKETPGSSNNAIDVLRAFLKSQGLPKIVWRESDQKNDGIFVGLTINDVSVIVSDKTKSTARYLAAKLMLRKLCSHYLSDPILKKYNLHEKTYRRAQVYDSHSFLTGKLVPACTINSVDELQGYDFTEEERWEILKNIPEHRLRRSHYMLALHPSCRELDFSFCPAAFSPTFLELIFKKAKDVESANLNNCYKTVNSSLCVETSVKKCRNLRSLSVNNCEFVRSEKIFENLRKYKVDLEQLNISNTIKTNGVSGSLQFQKYFRSQLGRRLRVLDISGLSLCENELGYILGSCKRLISLNLADTRFDSRCYCSNHDPGQIQFDSTVITNLRDLNISRTTCSKQILKLLIDNNRDLARLLKASSALTNAQVISEPINLHKLEHLRALDMSFQGSGAYEDFSLYKHDLPISLLYLNASGFCDLDMSHLSVVCPYLRSLTLNACIINTKITCRTKEDSRGKAETIPHSLQNLSYLVRLELRYSSVNLAELLESRFPLSLEELVIEGDSLDNDSLQYIVNSQVSTDISPYMTHVFNKLSTLHICNCNQVTDFGFNNCNFSAMPSLRNLTIERCSGVRAGTLNRLQRTLKLTSVFLTCFVDDERPKVHTPARHVEVVMG